MIVKSTAPCRISLFGGGTDLPEYSDKFGGLVISMAINIRQEITIYTGDNIFDIHKDQLPLHGTKEFMDAIFDHFKLWNEHHVRYISKSDALLNSGLGSSAAAAVAIIGAINKAEKLGMDKARIAEKAWEIEVGNLFGGRQDQYASAFGGFNGIIFQEGVVEVQPLDRRIIENLLPSLVLFHIGSTRKDPKIQEGLKKLSTSQVYKLDKIKDLATKAFDPLARGDIEMVGRILDLSWEFKKESNKGVSTPEIDKLYNRAQASGAYGGKLLGSGGGGYMLFIVNPLQRESFVEKMKLEEWDFDIDWNGVESRIL